MKITMAQLNFTIADFKENYSKIEKVCLENPSSDIIVFPELAFSGYYPWDLIDNDFFIAKQNEYIQQLISASQSINSYIIVGAITQAKNKKKKYNSALIIHQGQLIDTYNKKLLPTYNIFDEARHFIKGDKTVVFELQNEKIGVIICEDGWNDNKLYDENPIKDCVDKGASIIISLNASPSYENKEKKRISMFKKITQKYKVDIAYVNQVGGNDEIIFDGGSFYINKNSKLIYKANLFTEEVSTIDTTNNTEFIYKNMKKEEFFLQQIVVGVKDYMKKTGFKKVIIGSSGGIDSAITMAICSIALGSENVEAITMPSKYSSEGSVSDSETLSKNININLKNISIKDTFDTIKESMVGYIPNPTTLTQENLQSRIRGIMLMAYSNNNGNLLISTGNKSETSVGYCTLYGDTNGGINLIGDLYKTEVYKLAKYINKKYNNIIPQEIIDKEPSAELSEGQKDKDSLPPYDELDTILKYFIDYPYLTKKGKIKILNKISSYNKETIKKVEKLIYISEFKRRQSPIILKLKECSFGNGRKVPIVNKWINNSN